MASCYNIFEYWWGKGILESGEISETSGLPIIENEYVPCCWACGKPVFRDWLSDDKYERTLKELWSDKKVNSKLQKAHILAKQFGGPNTPDNLFLLCDDCHYESPDTKNRAAFFRWVYRKRKECCHGIHWKKMVAEFQNEITMRGYDPIRFLSQLKTVDVSEMVACAMEAAGTHSVYVVESSVVVAIVDEMERRVMASRAKELAM